VRPRDFGKLIGALTVCLLPLVGGGDSASAAEVKVLSANGVKAILVDLAPKFERVSGNKVTLTVGEAGEIKLNKGSYNAECVVRGEADIAVQAEHGIGCVPGIDFVQFPQSSREL